MSCVESCNIKLTQHFRLSIIAKSIQRREKNMCNNMLCSMPLFIYKLFPKPSFEGTHLLTKQSTIFLSNFTLIKAVEVSGKHCQSSGHAWKCWLREPLHKRAEFCPCSRSSFSAREAPLTSHFETHFQLIIRRKNQGKIWYHFRFDRTRRKASKSLVSSRIP